MVQEDLSKTQKDKFVLQAKVSELKNNMKTLLQQNQQLKLDLRRGAAKMVSRLWCRVWAYGERQTVGSISDIKLYSTHIQQPLCEMW